MKALLLVTLMLLGKLSPDMTFKASSTLGDSPRAENGDSVDSLSTLSPTLVRNENIIRLPTN